MIILSIDTSCDETAVSITKDTKILANIIWSQASIHGKWGGVVPSIAKREHEERIDFVIKNAMTKAFPKTLFSENNYLVLISRYIDAIAVTVGPGLAIALEVGIKKAKGLAEKYDKPLVAINHIEGHLLSCLATPNTDTEALVLDSIFPALGIVTSGGHTQIVLIEKIGQYKILASTIDDALGEALDKAARMLGLGYPGGPILEKMAQVGNDKKYLLPVPLIGQEKRMVFSYSGLKTALHRQVEKIRLFKKELTKKDIEDLSAVFQKTAFTHFVRVLDWMIVNNKIYGVKNVLAGGGVMANLELRKILRRLGKKHSLNIYFPYTKNLYGDNAAMIGIAAYYKRMRNEYDNEIDKVDRAPNAKIDQPFPWQYNP